MNPQPLSQSALKLASLCAKVETQLKAVSKQYQKNTTSALTEISKIARTLTDDLECIRPSNGRPDLVSRIVPGSRLERTLNQIFYICDITLHAIWRDVEVLNPTKKPSKLRRVSFGLLSRTRLSMDEPQLQQVLGTLRSQHTALTTLTPVLQL
jgi:hypothetical protein